MSDVRITITYSSDESIDSGMPSVHDSIAEMLNHTLPYMVDNIDIKWQVED